MNIFEQKSRILFILIAIIVIYISILVGSMGNFDNPKSIRDAQKFYNNQFDNSIVNARYVQTLALFDKGSIVLDKEMASIGLPDIGSLEGNYFSLFPFGMSSLILPAYTFGYIINSGYLFSNAVMLIFSILSGLLVFLIAKNVLKFKKNEALISASILLFFTLFFPYSRTIFQHNFLVFIALLMFYLVWKYRSSEGKATHLTLISGAIYGVSIFFDYPNPLLLSPILLYLILSFRDVYLIRKVEKINFSRNVILTVLIIFSLLFSSLLSSRLIYGNWFMTSNRLPMVSSMEEYQRPEYLMKNKNESEYKLNFLKEFDSVNIMSGLYTLSIEFGRGILMLSPILIFGIIGIYLLRRYVNLEILILILCIFVNMVFYSLFNFPGGGWGIGSRYAIFSIAILSIFVGFATSSLKTIFSRVIFLLLLIYSGLNALAIALTKIVVDPQINTYSIGVKNLKLIFDNITPIFIYNELLVDKIPLTVYFVIIFCIIITPTLLILRSVWVKK